ncbi:MAG: hypothetical protein AAGF07_02200 [Patescibacteria group bacterium]
MIDLDEFRIQGKMNYNRSATVILCLVVSIFCFDVNKDKTSDLPKVDSSVCGKTLNFRCSVLINDLIISASRGNIEYPELVGRRRGKVIIRKNNVRALFRIDLQDESVLSQSELEKLREELGVTY